MNVRPLAGDLTSALSHFAAVGLSAILAEGPQFGGPGDEFAKTCWSDDVPSRPLLWTTLDDTSVAEVVRGHAERHTHSSSWVQARVAGGVRAGSGLFSPRLTVCPAGELADFEAERQGVLTAASQGGDLSELDWRMLAGLGEPAWWRYTAKESQPDAGASRWEMKTRNRGEEFVAHRLAPLARCLSKRTAKQVWDGLVGRTVIDELGKGGPGSRTPTGFAPPGPTDSALAWCALWGIGVAPTVHLSPVADTNNGMSQTPGVWPRDRVHPRRACLPVFTSPVAPSRFRSVLSTRAFDAAAFGPLRAVDPGSDAAKAWLKGQGVRAMVNFRIHQGGSPSAPERYLLAGEVEPL